MTYVSQEHSRFAAGSHNHVAHQTFADMYLTQSICKSANRIHLAVQFSIGSHCPDATCRTIHEAFKTATDLLSFVDPLWLRMSYCSIIDDVGVPADNEKFAATISELLQELRVHQRPIARLGSILSTHGRDELPYSQLGDSLDLLSLALDRNQGWGTQSFSMEEETNEKLLAFSDAFYGLAVVIAAIDSPRGGLAGFRRAIALAGASVVCASTSRLSLEVAR